MKEKILNILTEEWEKWQDVKDTTPHFNFRDYVRDEFGLTYTGPRTEFDYTVVDKAKFVWFSLRIK